MRFQPPFYLLLISMSLKWAYSTGYFLLSQTSR
ncbi:MAG: hypothetical protein AVDCRST_MAG28-2366 [uncultured Rubrobacteraceae bacterium]|uniref:Uncharacterized protein n=1 Tax=uncultured Rubrobacteraceae bacterium TaxID=349277 RepID=A0A6J4QZF2_9ACTN|nr:MAG: hypothetical protein AVDCRST_MAG28-2366 [uncultured Rubrobacteraceae bacterium]